MFKIFNKSIFLLITLFTLFSCTKTPQLEFGEPWIREAPPTTTVLAGYVEIKNKSNTQRVLVQAESDDFGLIEFHETKITDGVASMVAQSELPISANTSLKLEPSGLHLMLMQPKRTLISGDNVKINFKFADGHSEVVTFKVKK